MREFLLRGIVMSWKNLLAVGAILASFSLAAPVAEAAVFDLIDSGITKAELIETLEGYGVKYEDSTRAGEDPIITVTGRNGIKYDILYYGCSGEGAAQRCKRLQFKAGWNMSSPLTLEQLNKYHNDYVFGRLYNAKSSDGTDVLWFDIGLIVQGGSRKMIVEYLNWWETISSQIKRDFNL